MDILLCVKLFYITTYLHHIYFAATLKESAKPLKMAGVAIRILY